MWTNIKISSSNKNGSIPTYRYHLLYLLIFFFTYIYISIIFVCYSFWGTELSGVPSKWTLKFLPKKKSYERTQKNSKFELEIYVMEPIRSPFHNPIKLKLIKNNSVWGGRIIWTPRCLGSYYHIQSDSIYVLTSKNGGFILYPPPARNRYPQNPH